MYCDQSGKYWLNLTCQWLYLLPLSIALDRAPVWRARWKFMSSEWRWWKTFLATRRMEFWATLAKTAFLISLKSDDPALAAPSIWWKNQRSVWFENISLWKPLFNTHEPWSYILTLRESSIKGRGSKETPFSSDSSHLLSPCNSFSKQWT